MSTEQTLPPCPKCGGVMPASVGECRNVHCPVGRDNREAADAPGFDRTEAHNDWWPHV